MSARSRMLVIGLVAAGVAGVAAYYVARGTRAHEHAAGAQGEQGQQVMRIVLESSTSVTVPYVVEQGIVWAIADGPWWKELRGDGDGVLVVIDGETIPARARAVEDDDALRAKVFARLRPGDTSASGVPIEVKLASWARRKNRGGA